MKKSIALLAACLLLTACGTSEEPPIQTSETTIEATTAPETYITTTETESSSVKFLSSMYQNIYYPVAMKMGTATYSEIKDEISKYADRYEITDMPEGLSGPVIVVTDSDYPNNKIIINFYCEDENGEPILNSTAFDYIGGQYEITVHDNFHDGRGIRYSVYCEGLPDEKIRSYNSIEECEQFVFLGEVSHDRIE